MPFGLTNALTPFLRTMDIPFTGFNWSTCLIYLDDVIVFLKLFDTHLQDVDMVLSTLQKAGVALNLWECYIFMDSVKYLGSIIPPGSLTIEEARIKSFNQLQNSRNVRKHRSFF